MDIYETAQECADSKIVYTDYAEYKNKYFVLDSWPAIQKEAIDTYNPPKIKHSIDYKYAADFNKDNFKKAIFFKQSKEAVQNSLYYMYHKYGVAYYIRIRNNTLIQFNYIWNDNYKNYLAKTLLIDPKYAKYYSKQDPSKWKVLGAMVRTFEKKYEGYAMDFYYSEIKFLLTKLCADYKISDCDFIIFGKDTMAIKADLSESAEEIVGSMSEELPPELLFKEYCPIFSFNWNPRFADIALPTPDDILRVFGVYSVPNCKNLYMPLPIIDWNKKIATAVFRGSFTGSSSRIKINPRLNISLISNKWKNDIRYNQNNKIDGVAYLDAGLSSKGGFTRGRKEIGDRYIRFVDKNYWPHMLVPPLNHEQQSHYKYILYIEGNAAAYRGAYLFSFGSVVLWVKSKKYYLWFEPFLQHRRNCIFIKNDLSDLADAITWLKQNDQAAQSIAIQGLTLYNTKLSKTALMEYSQYVINKVAAL